MTECRRKNLPCGEWHYIDATDYTDFAALFQHIHPVPVSSPPNGNARPRGRPSGSRPVRGQRAATSAFSASISAPWACTWRCSSAM